MHKSGFVNIIGRPNVGKSTLMNALVGERMSIITNKPQTTRHRIIGIVSDEDYQVVFSDTPGVVRDPAYKMHMAMNRFVDTTFKDGDVMLFLTEPNEYYTEDDPIIQKLKKMETPVFLVINKIDTISDKRVMDLIQQWTTLVNFTEIVPIAALEKMNTERLFKVILSYLKEGPAFYPKDQLTDKSERFFISEIIREKILQQYQQEIPYSAEVVVESFKETKTKNGDPLVRISSIIYVARQTQKSIIIGKGGTAIKKLGSAARRDIEVFLESKVFLELFVKVKDNWRDDDKFLKQFGYNQ